MIDRWMGGRGVESAQKFYTLLWYGEYVEEIAGTTHRTITVKKTIELEKDVTGSADVDGDHS